MSVWVGWLRRNTEIKGFLPIGSSVPCRDGWDALFEQLESKQDCIDIRDALTAIIEADDTQQEAKRALANPN